MIPTSRLFDQSIIAKLLDHDPLILAYRAFFALFDWSLVDAWQAQRSSRGRPAHPESAYLKAFLLRICENMTTSSQMRRYLVLHPLLVIELGFRLALDPEQPFGFDIEQTVPCEFWFRHHLHHMDHDLLTDLLQALVTALKEEIPGLGETVAFDVKHIYAWVRENNPRVYTKGRFDVTHIPEGDPDCRLGVKKSSNQVQPDGSTKTKKEGLFGYGSGVATSTDPVYGDVVLAEFTQPFNTGDITYFRPLYDQSVLALKTYPINIAADAAFDAWYVYQRAGVLGGIGAIAFNQHAHPLYERLADGTPLCPENMPMTAHFQFRHTRGFLAQRFRCPLLFPEKTGQTCPHAQFLKGKGCVKDVNWELGGKMRVTLDRDAPLYHAIYNQRTSAERINSQAQALGIERPKVRNGHSVANLNTLIYLVIDARVLANAKSINKGLLQMN